MHVAANDADTFAWCCLLTAGGAVHMNDGRVIVICDAHGVVQMANHAVKDVFGYSKVELCGKNVSLLMPPRLAAVHNTYGKSWLGIQFCWRRDLLLTSECSAPNPSTINTRLLHM